MKVSFLGAGAIGSMFGGLLQHYAPQVAVQLVVRGEHGQAITERGNVELAGPWGELQVPIAASFDSADIAGSRLVFLTVKSQATEATLAGAAPYLDDATVVSIQNGINDERLAKYVPRDRMVMGVTGTNMTVVAPGRVSLQLDGHTLCGPPAGARCGGGEQQVVDLLSHIRVPGLKFSTHPNHLGLRYNKLAINALGYTSCLSASNFITEALAHRAWRQHVGWPLLRECRHVFRTAGIELERLPGRSDLATIERLMRAFDAPVAGWIARRVTHKKFTEQPIVFSLYRDLLQNKTTEIDYVNGEIARLARASGTSAPLNVEVVHMAHELEARGGAAFYRREEVIDRLQAVVATPTRHPSGTAPHVPS